MIVGLTGHDKTEAGDMKLLICGKGGSGKSTVTALLALAMQKRGRRILVVDTDESNIGLYRMMGLNRPRTLMESLGGKKGFREKTAAAGASLGGRPKLFPDKMAVDSLPDSCIAGKNGLQVISLGKIHHFGEGCACPMGSLFRMLFASLDPENEDLVLIDTTAGVEHFGRRLDGMCDQILCVVDPSYESIMMGRKVAGLAGEIDLPVWTVLNKVMPSLETELEHGLEGLDIIGCLPHNDTVFLNNLKGTALDAGLPQLEPVCEAVESRL